MAGGNSIAATVSFNAFLCIIILISFEYLRLKVVDIYAPRSRLPNSLQPSKGFLGWIPQVYSISDGEMLQLAGMDGYVFLRFKKLCATLCSMCCIGAIILITVYSAAAGNDNVTGLDKLSMANIPSDSGGFELWVAWIFVYLFTAAFLLLFHWEYEHFAKIRGKYFAGHTGKVEPLVNCTVMVENIPKEYRKPEDLAALFDKLFPGEVMACCIALHSEDLDEKIAERDKVKRNLEESIALSKAIGKSPALLWNGYGPLALGNYCQPDTSKVDAIKYYTNRLNTLCAEVHSLQLPHDNTQSGLHHSPSISDRLHRAFYSTVPLPVRKPLANSYAIVKGATDSVTDMLTSATGFVTFTSYGVQQIAIAEADKVATMAAAVGRTRRSGPRLVVKPAPQPRDMVWENCSVATTQIKSVSFVTSVFYYIGLLFWSTVTALVAALSTLSTFKEYFPALGRLNPITYAVIEGILPVFVIMGFNWLLDSLMLFITHSIERRKTKTAIEMRIFEWSYMYQMVNIVLLLAAGSSIDILHNSGSLLKLIGAALPTVVVFYINFMLTRWLLNTSLALLRRTRTIEYLLLQLRGVLLGPLRLTRNRLMEGPFIRLNIGYSGCLRDGLYSLTIVLLYWVIAPLLLPFSAGLFWSQYIVYKYKYAFMVQASTDYGGQFWYDLYFYSMAALLVSALTFSGYMGVKQGVVQAPLLLPLPIIIVSCWRYTHKKFHRLSSLPEYVPVYGVPPSPVLSKTTVSPHRYHNLKEGCEMVEMANGTYSPGETQNTDGTVSLLDTCAPVSDGAAGAVPIVSAAGEGASSTAVPDPTAVVAAQAAELASTGKLDAARWAGRTRKLYCQPNLTAPAVVRPYPHRIKGIPLLTKQGMLNDVYLQDCPDELDIEESERTAT